MFLIQKCSPLLSFALFSPLLFSEKPVCIPLFGIFQTFACKRGDREGGKSLPVFVIALRVMCRMMWLLVCASTNTRRLSFFILLRSSSFRYLVPPDVAPDRSRGEEDEKDGG